MNSRVICIGKLKEQFYKDAVAEFTKRLSRYGSIEIVELDDERAPEKLSAELKEHVIALEGKRILNALKPSERVVALCIEGKAMSSLALASKIKAWDTYNSQATAFIIGGSLGLSPAVKNRAELLLSFSPMTFSHQIFRVMLLEQLYRAAKINANEVYHK